MKLFSPWNVYKYGKIVKMVSKNLLGEPCVNTPKQYPPEVS